MRQLLGLLVLVPVVATACGPGQHSPSSSRPNVLVFMLDAARVEHFGTYGYARETTPRLDAFAGHATVFDAASSEAAFTFPAVAAFMIGKLPAATGLLKPRRIEAGVTMLAERAATAGYRTFAYTENPYISAALGFEQGFERFVEQHDEAPVDEGRREKAEAARAEASKTAMRGLVDWMAGDERPFFAYVHILRPHNPYAPPEEFQGRFRTGPDIRALGYTENLLGIDAGLFALQPDLLETIIAMYDENLAFGDSLFGILWAGMQERKLGEDTIVVVTSDHGEAFGEHGRFLHSSTVYEEMIRVPLIVRVPGRPPGRVPTLVQLRDVTAALVDLFAWSGPEEGALPDPVDALAGARPAANPIVMSWTNPSDGLCAVRQGQHKLIVALGEEPRATELYDLGRDPGEKDPLSIEGSTVGARLLDHFRRARAEWESRAPVNAQPIEPEVAEHLRALGYSTE